MTCVLVLFGLVIVGVIAAWCWARQMSRARRDARQAYSFGRAAALAAVRDDILTAARLQHDEEADPHATLARVHEQHHRAAAAQDRMQQEERREAEHLARQLGLSSGGYAEVSAAAPLFRSAPPSYSQVEYHAGGGGQHSSGYAALRRGLVSFQLICLMAMWLNVSLNCPFSFL
jgi:hypothetical protein